jgi:hypothetical protein
LAVAAGAPWLVKNWIVIGAPLYPLFSQLKLQPWLASLYGTSAIPDVVNVQALSALAQARLHFNLIDLFIAPGRLTVEPEGAYYHMNMLYLLLPLSIAFIRNRTVIWLLVPPLCYLLLILIPFPATNLRYLFPAVAPLTVVAVLVAARTSERFFSAGAARLLLVCLCVLVLYPSAKSMHFWFRKSQVLGYFAGTVSENRYLETGFTYYYRLTEATNRLVPENARVLLLFEARGYYFEPQVIQDNVLTNWAFLAPLAEADTGCLEGSGITHVVVSDLAARYYILRGTEPQTLGIDSFPAFVQRCLTPVYRERGFTILRLRDGTDAQTEAEAG